MVNLTEFYIIYKKGKSENFAPGRSSVGVLLLCAGVDLQNEGYLKSGVVFGEIFQIHKKENSVAASPNHELMIFL